MGNLAHLVGKDNDDSLSLIAQMQAKLKRADDTVGTMASMLEKRLSEANHELNEALKETVNLNVAMKVDESIQTFSKSTMAIVGQLKELSREIQAMPKYAPPVDFTPALKKIEAKLDSRTHVFNVERDPISDLIKRITVTSK